MRFYGKIFLPNKSNLHLPRWMEKWLSYPVDEKALNLWTDHSPWYRIQRLLKCIDDDLYQHVRTRIPRVSDFQKRRSLIFHFLCFLEIYKVVQNPKILVKAVYWNFAKAFYKLKLSILIDKLKKNVFGGRLLKILSYLMNREQFVQNVSFMFDWLKQCLRVPFGAVILRTLQLTK